LTKHPKYTKYQHLVKILNYIIFSIHCRLQLKVEPIYFNFIHLITFYAYYCVLNILFKKTNISNYNLIRFVTTSYNHQLRIIITIKNNIGYELQILASLREESRKPSILYRMNCHRIVICDNCILLVNETSSKYYRCYATNVTDERLHKLNLMRNMSLEQLSANCLTTCSLALVNFSTYAH